MGMAASAGPTSLAQVRTPGPRAVSAGPLWQGECRPAGKSRIAAATRCAVSHRGHDVSTSHQSRARMRASMRMAQRYDAAVRCDIWLVL